MGAEAEINENKTERFFKCTPSPPAKATESAAARHSD